MNNGALLVRPMRNPSCGSGSSFFHRMPCTIGHLNIFFYIYFSIGSGSGQMGYFPTCIKPLAVIIFRPPSSDRTFSAKSLTALPTLQHICKAHKIHRTKANLAKELQSPHTRQTVFKYRQKKTKNTQGHPPPQQLNKYAVIK
jgi:hypothetical protein